VAVARRTTTRLWLLRRTSRFHRQHVLYGLCVASASRHRHRHRHRHLDR
jgi:hypothetical protein